MKKIVEGSVTQLFNTKFNVNSSKKEKTILLLDFNPIFYSSLFNEIKKMFPNVILLNQRRPAIWNKESLSIIKKTNCKIIRLEDLETSKIKSIINDQQQKQIKKLNKIFKNKTLFENFFIVEKHSFWNIIEDNFIEMILTRTKEIIKKYILSKQLFDKVNINGILEWAHSGFEERIVLANANERNIPVIFLQHAQNMSNSNYDKFIPFQPILPTTNSKTAIWGNISKEFLIEKGIKERESEHKSGKEDGIYSLWHENGQKKEEGPYKGETRIGEWTWWYENGTKWQEGSYLEGERDGIWKTWKRNGKRWKDETFDNGSFVSRKKY